MQLQGMLPFNIVLDKESNNLELNEKPHHISYHDARYLKFKNKKNHFLFYIQNVNSRDNSKNTSAIYGQVDSMVFQGFHKNQLDYDVEVSGSQTIVAPHHIIVVPQNHEINIHYQLWGKKEHSLNNNFSSYNLIPLMDNAQISLIESTNKDQIIHHLGFIHERSNLEVPLSGALVVTSLTGDSIAVPFNGFRDVDYSLCKKILTFIDKVQQEMIDFYIQENYLNMYQLKRSLDYSVKNMKDYLLRNIPHFIHDFKENSIITPRDPKMFPTEWGSSKANKNLKAPSKSIQKPLKDLRISKFNNLSRANTNQNYSFSSNILYDPNIDFHTKDLNYSEYEKKDISNVEVKTSTLELSKEIYASITSIITEYESYSVDLIKMMKDPIMVDLNVPEVSELDNLCDEFRMKMKISAILTLDDYLKLNTSFKKALRVSSKLQLSHFDDKSKKNIRDAQQMLTKAMHENTESNEKQIAVKGMFNKLEGVLPITNSSTKWVHQQVGLAELGA